MTNLFPKSWPEWTRPLAKIFLTGAACGVLGAVAGYTFGIVFPDVDPLLDVNLRWGDAVAAVAAVSLVIGAVAVLAVSLDPRRLGQMLNLEGPASSVEAGQARAQAVVMAFSGVLLLLPMIFSFAGLPPILGAMVIGLLMIVHTVMNVRVYRQADELLRRTMMEAATITFFLGQGVLFVWAAAERMGAVPQITAWDIYAVLMILYLLASLVVSVRRGLA